MSEIIVTALVSLVAAFGGAWAGAYFADLRRKNADKYRKRADNLTFGNLAFFTLMRQIDMLVEIQQSYRDRRTDPGKFINIPYIPPIDCDLFRFDFNSLSFLLNTKHRQCIQDLDLVERRFQKMTWLVNERSKIRSDIEPSLEKAGIKSGINDVSLQFMLEILGEAVLSKLVRYTDNMMDFVDRDIIDLLKTKDKLYVALSEIFPRDEIEKLFEEIPKELRPKEPIMNFDMLNPQENPPWNSWTP